MVLVDEKKGVYKDGHERPDVVAARIAYVKENADKYDDCMEHYSGDNMEVVVPAANGVHTHVSVYHDECIVAQNEGKNAYWGFLGAQDKCFAKSKGKSLMVSGFICHCHGEMSVASADMPEPVESPTALDEAAEIELSTVNTEPPPAKKQKQATMDSFLGGSGSGAPVAVKSTPAAPTPNGDDTPDTVEQKGLFNHSEKMFGAKTLSSFTVFEPGANAQGYWTGQDVVDQTVEVVKIFEKLHPGKIGVFEYDNSTNHSVLPKGALHAGSGVNKGAGGANAPGNPSGKNPTRMKNGWYIDKRTKQRVAQEMHLGNGLFKGSQQILRERGMVPVPALGKCTKQSRTKKKKKNVNECDPEARCCCHNVRVILQYYYLLLCIFRVVTVGLRFIRHAR
jgi:hypothetical protein